MNRATLALTLATLSAPMAFGQAPAADDVLARAREALGGGALERLETLIIGGRTARPGPQGTIERPFEMSIALPDRYMRREALAAMGNMSVYRHTGFNGPDGLIEELDQPPQLAGGGARIVMRGAGPGRALDADATPEEREAQRQAQLRATLQDYARLSLGMFAAAPSVYPLEIAYAGQAESPDGTAHILEAKGADGFACRLFIDTESHLPLMLSWMDKEPLPIQMMQTQIGGPGSRLSREEIETRVREREAELAEAEARRQTVEYRLFYGDYRSVGDLQLPHSFQRMASGQVLEETTFDRIRVNVRIDDDRFRVSR